MRDLTTQLSQALAGRYSVERELGRGGMATVFLARDLRHSRPVALKIIHPEIATGVGIERFEREIQLAARLQHPHILAVLDSGDLLGGPGEPDLLWFTMPYVEGETVRDRLTREVQLPIADALRIAHEVAGALDYAHRQGVIHRDIKPENILLTESHALVADFGVARAIASERGAGLPDAGPVTLTATGVTVGTVSYMSPEQASGEPNLDGRTDQYSLACVLYEMLAGEPPFTGPTAQAVVTRRFTEEARALRAARPAVPAAVERAVASALSRTPADRYSSLAAFACALEQTDPQDSAAVSPTRPRVGRRPRARVLGLGVLLGVGVLFAWRWIGPKVAGSPGRIPPVASPALGPQSVAVVPFVNASGDPENEHFSSGLTDELIALLGQMPGLKVVARASVFALSGRDLSPAAIADTLGVAFIIRASVRREGSRLKLTAELIKAADGSALWSEGFDRQIVDVFSVQEEIARAIVVALNVRVTEDVRAHLAGRLTADLEAYDLYLKGQYALLRPGRDRAGLEAAVAHFRSAIERDSTFALPYPALVWAYVNMSNFRYLPLTEALSRAEPAADRALALDSLLWEAHAAKAYVLTTQGRYPEAEARFLRAIELNPSASEVRHYYSLLLMMLGRPAEALAQNGLAISLNPLWPPPRSNRGIILCQQGNCLEGRRALYESLPMSTGLPFPFAFLGALEAAEGRYLEALPLLQRAESIAAGFGSARGALAYVYRRLGRQREADAVLDKARAGLGDEVSRSQLALVEAVNGDTDRAYELLSQPSRWNMPTAIALRADPLLARFRADPRYPGLLERNGLPR